MISGRNTKSQTALNSSNREHASIDSALQNKSTIQLMPIEKNKLTGRQSNGLPVSSSEQRLPELTRLKTEDVNPYGLN